jgi:hypothetical protein
LKTGTEEGLTESRHLGLEWKSHSGKPVIFGLITSMTIDSYKEFAESWKKNGFLSRLIPFSFKHSSLTQQEIQREITLGIERYLDPIKRKEFKKVERPVAENKPNSPLEIFESISQNLARQVIAEPYRNQKQLNALVFSNAVLNKHKKIELSDVTDILRNKWINYEFNDI